MRAGCQRRAGCQIGPEDCEPGSGGDHHSRPHGGAVARSFGCNRRWIGIAGPGVAINLARDPEQSAQLEALKALVVPYLVKVAQRRVKHAAGAVEMTPGRRKILGAWVHTREGKVDRSGVDAHEHTRARAREAAELVNLLRDGERGPQGRRGGVVGIFQVEADRLHPGMSIKPGADEIAVFGPRIEGVSGAMHTHEALAALHEL